MAEMDGSGRAELASAHARIAALESALESRVPAAQITSTQTSPRKAGKGKKYLAITALAGPIVCAVSILANDFRPLVAWGVVFMFSLGIAANVSVMRDQRRAALAQESVRAEELRRLIAAAVVEAKANDREQSPPCASGRAG